MRKEHKEQQQNDGWVGNGDQQLVDQGIQNLQESVHKIRQGEYLNNH